MDTDGNSISAEGSTRYVSDGKALVSTGAEGFAGIVSDGQVNLSLFLLSRLNSELDSNFVNRDSCQLLCRANRDEENMK